MPTRTVQLMTSQDFQELLDVYGADRTRWPLSVRAGAAALLAADADARRLLAEATALDAVLASGMKESAADVATTSALAARIVTSAARTPRIVAEAPHHVTSSSKVTRASSGSFRAAAVLAASLVLGVFVGQSQLGAYALPKIAALAGVSIVSADRLAMADIEFEASDVE